MKKYVIMVMLAFMMVGCETTTLRDVSVIKQQAQAGDVNAQAEIGYSYQYGDGVKKDAREALKWNLKAARQGNAMAQHNLAVMYDEGVDIAGNKSEAIRWYRKAAEQGHPRAQCNLGIMYWRGDGVAKDMKKAWNLLNTVRISSTDRQAKWAARNALDKIKAEIGATAGTFSYPKWDDLQKTIK